MKNMIRYFILAPLFILFLTRCGDNGNNNYQPAVVGATSCQGACQDPSLVQTSLGCLPQGNCGPCMGLSNGSCVQSTMGNYPGGMGASGQGFAPPNQFGYPTTGFSSGPVYGSPQYIPQQNYSPGFSYYYYHY
jgi:hypothetical protein